MKWMSSFVLLGKYMFVFGSFLWQSLRLTECRFDTSFVPRFPIIANGRNVQDIQRKRAISYLAMAVPESKTKIFLLFNLPCD